MENILLVDDDEDLLLVLKHALTANGYTVTAIADPSTVMKTIAAVKPDIIILDINMGKWDGRVICKEIKGTQLYSQIPVVLYSGVAEKEVALVNSKADLFLQKPLSTNYFIKKIDALMTA